MEKTTKYKIINALKKVEEALQITLEKESDKTQQENTYKSYSNSRIDNLTLSNISFENFDALAPVYKMVDSLKFINCTINNISALLNLERVNHLTFDRVSLKEVYNPNSQVEDTLKGHFQSVEFENMEIEHISILQPFSKKIEYLGFTKCTIKNFYEVNLLPSLYSLSLNDVIIHKTSKDVVHKANANRRFIFLKFKNMQIDNFDFFLPISEKNQNLEIDNCTIGSLQGIPKFPKLEKLEIDASTVIDVMKIPTDKSTSFQLIECEIIKPEIDDDAEEDEKIKSKAVFNFQKLAFISSIIKSLKFYDNKLCNIEYLKHFSQLETLEFEKCKVNFNHFLSVAQQIKAMSLDTCTLKKTKALVFFTQLESLDIIDGYDKGHEVKPLKNLKKLLALKHQLKKLSLWESDVKSLKYIKYFTALESLYFFKASKKTAENILSLPNLKRLQIDIITKRPCSFDLRGIKNIEWLVLDSSHELRLEGLEDLNRLERLELEGTVNGSKIHHLKNLRHFKCNSATNINEVGTIKTLKTLEFGVSTEYEIKGLQQFPNLAYLSIKGGDKVTLGKLDKLKVLDMEGGYPKKINFLNELPNLEKLDLGYKELTEIPDLKTLTKLRVLSLAENGHIKNIEGLKYLKRLEHLNLYDNKISDIRVLNTLPNLKKVNIAGNLIDKIEVKKQLEKPVIAVFYSLPYVPFRIWRSDNFEC